MTSEVTYLGNLRTSCKHIKSGDVFVTDAPTDNNGLGKAFSPTDSIATALASCMFTIMGIKSRDLDIDLSNSKADVNKVMESNPRRISEIHIYFNMNVKLSSKDQTILEKAAMKCPVIYSIHPDIKKEIHFNWG
jgi:uncharacterized OsmC-like protein